jgi:ribosome maturation factor RimP
MDKRDLFEHLSKELELMGYELVDLRANLAKNGLVRIDIDKKGGIDITDCEIVSKAMSTFLDVIYPVDYNYNLEVSTPGLNRKLSKKQHFIDHIECSVKVKIYKAEKEVTTIYGLISSADDAGITLSNGSNDQFIPFNQIIEANLNM